MKNLVKRFKTQTQNQRYTEFCSAVWRGREESEFIKVRKLNKPCSNRYSDI